MYTFMFLEHLVLGVSLYQKQRIFHVILTCLFRFIWRKKAIYYWWMYSIMKVVCLFNNLMLMCTVKGRRHTYKCLLISHYEHVETGILSPYSRRAINPSPSHTCGRSSHFGSQVRTKLWCMWCRSCITSSYVSNQQKGKGLTWVSFFCQSVIKFIVNIQQDKTYCENRNGIWIS